MYFSIDRKTFSDALGIVSRAIAPYSPIPALSGVYMELDGDGLTLIGSDNNIAIQVHIPPSESSGLDIRETGKMLVEAKYLNEMIRKMECSTIELETADLMLIRVTSNNGQYNLNGIPLVEYPPLDFAQPASHFQLSQADLKNIIQKTAFACSTTDARPVLTGVNFRASGSRLVCSGSDSYRLAYCMKDLQEDHNFNITVPAKTLNELYKSLQDSQDLVDIYVDNRKIQFQLGNSLFQSRLIDGRYPEVERIIPKDTSAIATLRVDSKEPARAIDRTNFIVSERVHLVKLECSRQETRIKTSSAQIGNSNEVLNSAHFEGEDFSILFNGAFMVEALRALHGDDVLFTFTGSMSPAKAMLENDPDTLMVMVPVRSND